MPHPEKQRLLENRQNKTQQKVINKFFHK